MNKLLSQSLKISKFYFAVSLIANKELVYFLNELFLDKHGKIFHFDLDSIYSSSFNGYAVAVLGLIIAVSIPLLINLYTNANQGNTLTKLFIKEKFNSDDILFFLVFTTGFLISRNSILILLGFLYVVYLLFKKSQLYFKFLYKTHDTLFEFIKEVSKNSKHRDAKYKKRVDDFEKVVAQSVYCPGDFNYSLDSISFYSEKFVSGFHSSQLKDFVQNIDKKIRGHLEAVNHESSEGIKKISPRPSFHVGYDMSEQQIVLYVSITNKDDEDYKKFLRDVFHEFKHHYRERLFTYDKEPLEENLFNKLDAYIYSLAKMGNFYELEKLIKLIKEVFDSRIEISERTIRELSISNHNLFTIYNDIQDNRAYSSVLFKYWYSYFKASTTNSSENYISFAIHDLYNAITNKIFCEEDIEELDRKITFLYKIEKVTPATIFRYVNALITISVKFKSAGQIDYAFKMLSFIKYLIDDFEAEKSYIKEQYTDSEYQEIINICREGLTLSIFYKFSSNPDEAKRFLSLLDKKNIFATCKELYIHEDRRWNTFSWDRDKFNRHGMGQVSSFCATNTLKTGLLEFLKVTNYSQAGLSNFYIPFVMLHFFNELKTSLESLETNDSISSFIAMLNTKITASENDKKEAIILEELDVGKMESLVNECDNSYSEEFKITSLFDTDVSSNISDQALGIYTTLSKDLFIKENAVAFFGLADIGRNIATGENRLLTEKIVDEVRPIDISEQDFFCNLEQLFNENSGKEFLFVGDKYNFEYDTFNWEGIEEVSKYDKELIKKRSNGKRDKLILQRGISEYTINLAYADKTSESYVIIFNKDDIKVHYNLHKKESDLSSNRTNNTYYDFVHYYKDEELRKEIIEKGHYQFDDNVTTDEDKHFELNQKIGFKAYSLPEIVSINNESLKVYKLTKSAED